uniref:Poly-gamma-glutamate biosynthesis protein PgsC/CapC/poly-gamma-glutamate synthase PgsB/CapB,TIGR04012 n=1 Tax=Candidatus Kentrum eta TaxID=2126337 RepID=A0A450U795_9GAMM|nr:MAG: poly-gamma-glutamate biosynthesis protein PgsC/CapC/poly-gamma-glutamate synthase PgsB/CapB,TIGR04012 [Candidatus Kentron sp. H]VFJ89388.1 MAG: poly-gamma-glutamate biosynthesis protein PgsC/CapC/poly-gamma-glutamate synthase PgsB/CapB,TIGR04012 [Candidatus Kentron sp. H]VFJ95968.1 MAG: poly-gamma-glutamate biosynthesis protein PgsC/CapC/poly-gamma-glutamate synthase PgsB/CapB,TIGR04012 [Candidatus Kentron sp. H]
MNVLATVAVSMVVFLLYLILEYAFHRRNLKSIPIRIHVNGTRGKSSVTRLIGAALKEAGFNVVAKTTGTLPRIITGDGVEIPVYRLEDHPNIIEQLRVFSFAAKNHANALVIECMALNPNIQSVSELDIVKSTHGVIVNTRADHLDVMGPTERDVALALLGTVPRNARLFTSEHNYRDEFEMACRDRGSELIVVPEQAARAISDEEMRRFPYIEHKENVALTLRICQSLDIPRETALRGMYKVLPDVGAMHEYHVDFFGVKQVVFINGFAANDPKSSRDLWDGALERHKDRQRRIMVINTRWDRLPRSKQIAESLATCYLDDPWNIAATFAVSWLAYFIVGRLSYVVIIYGRRKTALLILMGFLLGYLSDILLFGHELGGQDLSAIDVIGHIIPGPIASGIASHGAVTTFSSVITCSVIVRLLLILLGL